MKNANRRGMNNLNQRPPDDTAIIVVIQLVLALILAAIVFFGFGCAPKPYRPSEKAVRLKPMQPYLLPGGHRLTAHNGAIFIIDSAGKRLFNVYVRDGKVAITDSEALNQPKNGGQ